MGAVRAVAGNEPRVILQLRELRELSLLPVAHVIGQLGELAQARLRLEGVVFKLARRRGNFRGLGDWVPPGSLSIVNAQPLLIRVDSQLPSLAREHIVLLCCAAAQLKMRGGHASSPRSMVSRLALKALKSLLSASTFGAIVTAALALSLAVLA